MQSLVADLDTDNFLESSFWMEINPESSYKLDDKAIELLKMNVDSSPISGPCDSSSDEEHQIASSPLFNPLDNLTDQNFLKEWENFPLDLTNMDELFSLFSEDSTPEELPRKKESPLDKENQEGKAKSKKRGRNSVPSQTPSDFKELSKDDLLKLNSKEIELYIQKIHSVKHLTIQQDKELKKVRRLIKNREYAASSRMKKKSYVDDMEKQLSEAKVETKNLRERVQSLELENKTLKYQLAQIGAAMKRDPEVAERLKKATSIAPPSKKLKTNPSMAPKLFIILFSFALFLNFFSLYTNPFDSSSQISTKCPRNSRCLFDLSNGAVIVEDQPSFLNYFFPDWLLSMIASFGSSLDSTKFIDPNITDSLCHNCDSLLHWARS